MNKKAYSKIGIQLAVLRIAPLIFSLVLNGWKPVMCIKVMLEEDDIVKKNCMQASTLAGACAA